MKVGISSAVFYPQESEKAFDRALALGFDTFEFFFNCDYEISDEFVDIIKAKCVASSADIISLHPYTAFAESVFLFSDYARRTEENIKRYTNSFRMAKKLGAKYFTFHGDRIPNGKVRGEFVFTERHADMLNRLCAAAADNGVKLCLENVSWCKSSDPEYLYRVARAVPDIFFTLDLKQARRAGVPVKEYISVMGDRIENIHISDFDKKRDCLLPGEGALDYKEFFSLVPKYSGDVIIEVYSSNFKDDGQLLTAKKHLEKTIAE